MGLETQTQVIQPDVSQLIGRASDIVTPNAVSAMTDAFRQGQITANDIMDRVGERARLKEKADVMALKEQTSPEAVQGRQTALAAATARAKSEVENAALAQVAQKAQLEQQAIKGMLGPNAEMIGAAYASIGRMIPIKASTELPGTKIPDLDTITQDMPKIVAFQNDQKKRQTLDAGWEPVTIVEKDAQGATKDKKGFWNKFTGDTSDKMPMSSSPTFDQWLENQKPGTVQVSPTPAIPAPSVTGTTAPASVVVQPKAPDTSTWLTTKTEAAQTDRSSAVNQIAQRYQTNPAIVGLAQAKSAYDATSDVMSKIQPDGNYAADVQFLPKQGDYKLMVGYAKILDPNSVVREGEITLLAGTKSSWDRLAQAFKTSGHGEFSNYINTVLGRQMFTPAERKSFKSLLEGSYTNRINAARELRDSNAQTLKRMGIAEEDLNTYLPLNVSGAPTATTSPATNVSPNRVTVNLPGKGLINFDLSTGKYSPVRP